MAGDRSSDGDAGVWRRWRQRLARRIRQWRGQEPRLRVRIRCQRREHGGWWICPQALREGDIAYAFGVGGDLVLERALAEQYGARVYAFDPAPRAPERAAAAGLPSTVELLPMGVAAHNGRRTLDADGVSTDARVLRLSAHMRNLAHRRLDLLKLDAAGGEFAALRELPTMDVDVRQVLVRFGAGVGGDERGRVEEVVRGLESHGYRIFHISPDGRTYSLIRTEMVGR